MLIHIEIEDLLLDHLWVFALERVAFVKNVIDAASQRPDVNLIAEAAFFEDELWGRVVNMTAEVATPQKFFEVVGKANSVKLDDTTFKLLNPTWMDISVDVVVRVEEGKSTNDLLKHVKRLVIAHVLLAKGFPLANGVWRFHLHEEEVVGHDPIVIYRHQMLVLKVLQSLDHLNSATAFLLVECRDVNARHHFIFVGVLVVNEKNLAIALAKVE